MSKENRDEIKDQDMDRILDVLHQMPEEKIPAHFEQRLQKALTEEGKKMAASKTGWAKRNKNKIKILASVAACFIVGFATLAMYNKDMDAGPQESKYEEMNLFMEDEGSSVKTGDNKDLSENEKEIYGRAAGSPDEFTLYLELINEYLGHEEYQLLSQTKDPATNHYVFKIDIRKDKDGNPVNESIVLIGAEGEIYEQQP